MSLFYNTGYQNYYIFSNDHTQVIYSGNFACQDQISPISLPLKMPRIVPVIKILLANDDKDDKMLFQEVLDELSLKTELTTVYNGEQLMKQLNEVKKQLPDMLFLDLNMPRKNGFDCLLEIRTNKQLDNFPVIVFTTSSEPDVINLLYKAGATYYIRKPNNYDELKNVIEKAVILITQKKATHPAREQFVLSTHSLLHDQ